MVMILCTESSLPLLDLESSEKSVIPVVLRPRYWTSHISSDLLG